MLLLNKEDIEIVSQEKNICSCCEKRRATWKVRSKESGEMVLMCGWCTLYSGKSKWGYENRDDILHVGRAAQEQALKVNRPIPEIDDRGRIFPGDAERFLLGVAFTTKLVPKLGLDLR